MPDIKAFFDAPTGTVTYLVSDPATSKAALIDPLLDYEPSAARLETRSADAVLDHARSAGLKVDWVLETHAHADHLSAADYVREQTGARIGVGAHIADVQRVFKPLFLAGDVKTDGSQFDALFEDGANFSIGALNASVMHTPGHTPACVTYLIGDAAFVGDTIFMPDFGTARTDFPGGDAETLYRSIRRILDLPAETRIFVGHDYPPTERSAPAWESSVAEQRKKNVHVHDGASQEDFVRFRNERDATLAPPRLILPSLQVNIRAGAAPPPAEDGETYLTIPVNRL